MAGASRHFILQAPRSGTTLYTQAVAATLTATPAISKKVKLPYAASLVLTCAQLRKKTARRALAATLTLTVTQAVKKTIRLIITGAFNTTTVTAGKIVAGASSQVAGANFISVTKVTLPRKHHVLSVRSLHRGDGTVGSAKLRPILFSDNSGPDQLMEAGAEVSVDTADTSSRFIDFSFSATAFAPGSTAYVGWMLGPGCNHLLFYFDTGAFGIEQFQASAYTSTGNPTVGGWTGTSTEYTVAAVLPALDSVLIRRLTRAATLTLTGALVRRVRYRLAATLTLTAAIARKFTYRRILTSFLAMTYAISRRMTYRRTRAATLTMTPTMSTHKFFFIKLDRPMTLTVSLFRTVKSTLAGSLTLTGVVSRRIGYARSLAASLASANVISRHSSRFRAVDAPLDFTLDVQAGGMHNISIERALNLTLAISKKVRLFMVDVLMQTNPRMNMKVSAHRLFSASLTMLSVISRRSARHVTRAATLDTQPQLRVSIFAPTTFRATLVTTLGFGINKKFRRLMPISLNLAPTTRKIVRKVLRVVLHSGQVMKTRPLRYLVVGTSGLIGAAHKSGNQLLSALGLRENP